MPLSPHGSNKGRFGIALFNGAGAGMREKTKKKSSAKRLSEDFPWQRHTESDGVLYQSLPNGIIHFARVEAAAKMGLPKTPSAENEVPRVTKRSTVGDVGQVADVKLTQ